MTPMFFCRLIMIFFLLLAVPAAVNAGVSRLNPLTLQVDTTGLVYSDGKVGINTATPSATLQIVSSGDSVLPLAVGGKDAWPAAGTRVAIEFRSSETAAFPADDTQYARIGAVNQAVNGGNKSLYIHTGGAERLHLDYVGDVGTGSTPLANLITNDNAAVSLVRTSDTVITDIYVTGDIDGAARVYVGQSTIFGGGMLFTGDDSPDVVGDADQMVFFRRNNSTDVRVIWYAHNANQVHFVSPISQPSDKRLKTDIQPIENALARLNRLTPVYFYWDRDAHPDKGFSLRRQIGFIAQDVEKVFPELVSTDNDGYRYMAYSPLTAVLIEAAREQQNKIEALNARNDELERLLEKQEAQLAALDQVFSAIRDGTIPSANKQEGKQ